MPTIGPFHQIFWRSKANAPPPPPGASPAWMYPGIQSVTGASSMMFAFGVPLGWIWAVLQWIWTWRVPARYLLQHGLDEEQRAVVDRVVSELLSPQWQDARERVRTCATSPKFHKPEQWTEYSRAVKADAGHAQNVWRHMKVVLGLRGAHPDLSNPDAHLLAELAYQGFAHGPRVFKIRPVVKQPGIWSRLWVKRKVA